MRYRFFLLGGAAFLIACTPVINQRGYMQDPALESAIRAGTDSKASVQDRLGYASTTATFSGDAWYYISSTEKQVAFFTPTVLNRNILAIYFDKNGRVQTLRHYTLAQGHVISLEDRTTPARGRELTFLQQLMNATPSSGNPMGQQETNPGGGSIP